MKLDIPFEHNQVQSTNKEVTRQSNYERARTVDTGYGSERPRFQGSEGYQEAIQNSMPEPVKQKPVIAETKVGRNDPCPCGSGKKYKQCHGK